MEDFGSIQHMSLPESTLQQAIVNTQVGQQFYFMFIMLAERQAPSNAVVITYSKFIFHAFGVFSF